MPVEFVIAFLYAAVSRSGRQQEGRHSMRASIALFGLCWLTASAFCQRGPAPYYEDTNNIPTSPEVHPDRTVTFRLFAPKASEVVLMGSPGILEAIKEPKPLQKGDKG